MAERISLEQVERKAGEINRDFSTDIEVERYNGAYRAVCNKGSKNLTPLMTKRDLWTALDMIEEGIWLGLKRAETLCKLKEMALSHDINILGATTGRSSSDKSNIREIDKDGRPRTEGTGK